VPAGFGLWGSTIDLELVDWTGRALPSDKRRHIEAGTPRILDRLHIDGERFIGYADRLLKAFGSQAKESPHKRLGPFGMVV
jgi:hypothetical protein